jgi:hypothetical protein
MKKVILSLVVVAALSSCKKDYTCTCTGGGLSVSTTIHDTKSSATTACTAHNNSASSVTCTIN